MENEVDFSAGFRFNGEQFEAITSVNGITKSTPIGEFKGRKPKTFRLEIKALTKNALVVFHFIGRKKVTTHVIQMTKGEA